MSFLLMMVIIFGIMWFFMIRPQQKKQKEIQNFRNNIARGQQIVTAGGIYGTVKDIDEAIDLAVKAEHGNRHTAHMHSKNIDNLTRFARAVETTIFVKNAPSYAGIGFGGEGHTTFTIAGPTGEGITSAKSFTRQRRCVLSESFRII